MTGTGGDGGAHREGEHSGHGAETADAHLRDFDRLAEPARPESPKRYGAYKKSYRHDRVEGVSHVVGICVRRK